ncbi:hypothetical protein Scep_012615 [Stephania cephalantha]|uniref:DUF4216 domain-containing protein n=1 Tax=Stephania cephalantha TaxID=152367 RepID=A0AAP0P6M7_9MAGN
MRTHPTLKLVEIHRSRRYNNYEPFVLAMQATQVYYLSYPSLMNERQEWLAVCCCQPKFGDEEMNKDDNDQSSAEIAFQDGEPTTCIVNDAIHDFNNLDDPNGTRIIVEVGPSQEGNDFIVDSGDDSKENSSTSSHGVNLKRMTASNVLWLAVISPHFEVVQYLRAVEGYL